MKDRSSRAGLPGKRRTALLFLAPLLLLVIIFIAVPVAGTFHTSLHRDVTFMPVRFDGLKNFMELSADSDFRSSLIFTLSFTAATVPIELLIGLAMALILNERLPMRGLLRACMLIPWAVPTVVSARLWQLVFNYQFGVANAFLAGSFIEAEPINWLGTGASAFCALAAADIWKTSAFVAIILLAGLQSISDDLYEQARIDQANMLQRFLHVTLPLLAPTILVALLFRAIDALRIFDLIYIITGGGPGGSTNALSIHSFHLFTSGDFGRGSAVSVALFLIAFTLSIALARRNQITGLPGTPQCGGTDLPGTGLPKTGSAR